MTFATCSALSAALALLVTWAVPAAQDRTPLTSSEPPPNGVWIDSLDLSNSPIRRPRAGRGQTTPPPPLTFALGGTPYPHALPLLANTDLTLDLHGQATRFLADIGVDDERKDGQATVIFGVWVDGKKVADSSLMKSGEPPKRLAIDLTPRQAAHAGRERRRRWPARRFCGFRRRGHRDGARRRAAVDCRRASRDEAGNRAEPQRAAESQLAAHHGRDTRTPVPLPHPGERRRAADVRGEGTARGSCARFAYRHHHRLARTGRPHGRRRHRQGSGWHGDWADCHRRRRRRAGADTAARLELVERLGRNGRPTRKCGPRRTAWSRAGSRRRDTPT